MAAIGLSMERLKGRGQRSSAVTLLVGVALLAAMGFVDWVTGPQIALSLLYVVPVTWMTLRGGRWLGLSMAVASGGVWLWAELIAHVTYTNPWVPYWNAAVRLTLFCLISALEWEVVERKRVEQGLQEQTSILQSILNSMGDGVVVVDRRGRLLHINPAARRMLHLSGTETDLAAWLESQEDGRPGVPGAPANGEGPLPQAVRGERMDGAEVLFRHSDDHAGVWLSVSSRPLVDQADQTTGAVLVLSDISTRKNLERQIAEISDREQRRLGEDLHDGVCQHLVSVAFAARKLAGRLGERSLPETADATQIAELLGESIAQARSVARGLYLVPLEAGGLRSALEEFLLQVRSRHRVECAFTEQVAVSIVGEMVVRNLFRIAQEAVNNAIKHAAARHIWVALSADGEQIWLTVEDDGTGFQPNLHEKRGMGLHLMNYRARMLGAVLHIEPRPGGGTRVSCCVRRENLTEPAAYEQRE